MKKFYFIGLTLMLLFSAVIAQAQLSQDLEQARKIDVAVAKCAAEVRELLAPFSAAAGFPSVKPEGLEKADYHQLYRAAASRAQKASRLFADFIKANKLPYRAEFSARYFMKRLEIASFEYAGMTGNARVFEHLCRDFASACDRGLAELRLWAVAEPMSFDNIWFKNIQEGFKPVTAKMNQVVIPEHVNPTQAREVWKKAAASLMEAGNAAGLASTKVGAGGLIGIPAYRLRLAIKYYKAACKAAVIDMWHSRETDPRLWMSACKKLRHEVNIINAEIGNFLAMYGGNPAEIKPVMYMMPASASRHYADSEPIEVKASASDKGFSVKTGENSLTISGIADGPEVAKDIMGIPVGDYARSVRFTLDIDKAPTKNAFGKTDYTKKNRRIFTVFTSKGATAEQVARALAKKVNDARDFRASVRVESDDSAQLNFSHR